MNRPAVTCRSPQPPPRAVSAGPALSTFLLLVAGSGRDHLAAEKRRTRCSTQLQVSLPACVSHSTLHASCLILSRLPLALAELLC